MKSHAHVDFEAFSFVAPKDVGTCLYSEHPTTEPICMGWAIDDEEPELWVPKKSFDQLMKSGRGIPEAEEILDVACYEPPARLFELIQDGGLVYAWNAEMEIPFWQTMCVDQMWWPEVPLEQWRDTEILALSYAFPAALEKCGAALGLDVTKDKRGKHLINKLCKPRKPSKNNPATRWTPLTAPKDFADFYEYCRQDVRSERAILEALPADDLTESELELWFMTVRMNLRGWTVDADSVDRMLDLVARHKKKAHAELEEITDGVVTTGGQIDRMLAWLSDERDVHLPNFQKDTITRALAKRDLPDDARRLMEIRQELGRASVKKYDSMLTRRCRDGTVKNNLMHHGASTGRDAGRGLQIQNMFRGSVSGTDEGVEAAIRDLHSDYADEVIPILYESVPRFASEMQRSMLTSRDGHVLFSGDFSSIENRVTVWGAGSEYGLNIFRDDRDQYVEFGMEYYGVEYDEVTEPQRDHSKRAVLGCCFGMGEDTFIKQAAQYGSPTTKRVAKKTIKKYRDLYPEVVALWYGLSKAAISCVREGRPTRYKTTYCEIRFELERDFLFMVLPSGRRLAYPSPRVEMKKTPWGALKPTVTHMGLHNHQWVRRKIIPGRFCENFVQATARDVMMEGARALARAKYELLGRVHDELVHEREIGTGDLDEYQELMCPSISWLRGVPIEAKVWTGKRYRK